MQYNVILEHLFILFVIFRLDFRQQTAMVDIVKKRLRNVIKTGSKVSVVPNYFAADDRSERYHGTVVLLSRLQKFQM